MWPVKCGMKLFIHFQKKPESPPHGTISSTIHSDVCNILLDWVVLHCAVLLACCEGNPPVTGVFFHKGPAMWRWPMDHHHKWRPVIWETFHIYYVWTIYRLVCWWLHGIYLYTCRNKNCTWTIPVWFNNWSMKCYLLSQRHLQITTRVGVTKSLSSCIITPNFLDYKGIITVWMSGSNLPGVAA